MIVTAFCKLMNHTTIPTLVTTIMITTAAVLTIAIASSLIDRDNLVGLAFAAKKVVDNEVPNTMAQPNDDNMNNSNSPKSLNANTDDLNGNTVNNDDIYAKQLKKFSKCLTGVASDGELTLIEVTDCYHQVF
jgi:hypothetical protein